LTVPILPISEKLIYVVEELSDSEVLPCNGLEKPTFMVKFERFKVGILTCKLRKHHQRAQFFNPRPQAFGVNGSSHPIE
jgi:hypothetical protein